MIVTSNVTMLLNKKQKVFHLFLDRSDSIFGLWNGKMVIL